MSRWSETGMGFKRVKVSPEMVGILVGGLAGLALVWDLSRDVSDLQVGMSSQISDLRVEMSDLRAEVFDQMSDLRVEMSDLRTEVFDQMSDLRVEMSNEISSLNERMAHVEGLLQGYIGQPRAEKEEVAQTE